MCDLNHRSASTNFMQRTMCGTSVQMWQQLVGGNVMMYYVVYVFSMAGLVSKSETRVGIFQP